MISLSRLLALLFSFDGVMKRRTYAIVSLICVAGLLHLLYFAWPTVRPDALLNDPASPDGFGLVGYWAFRPLAPVCVIWMFSAASFKRLKAAQFREAWLLTPLLVFNASLILVAFPRALDAWTLELVSLVFSTSGLALVALWIALLNASDRVADTGAQQGHAPNRMSH